MPVEAFCETFLEFCDARVNGRWTNRMALWRRVKSTPPARSENLVLRAGTRAGRVSAGQNSGEKQSAVKKKKTNNTSIQISLHGLIE